MHSDPVADMLTRIRNGSRARLVRVDVRFSRHIADMARILKREGYINDFRVVGSEPAKKTLDVALRYSDRGEPVIRSIKRMSTPGRRRHFRCDDLPKVLGGLGVIIVSTSRGLMTDNEARRARVGGEALCSIS